MERKGGHEVGLVVKLTAKDNERVGNHWMRGRLLDGDLAICLEHTGDCFWDYQLLRQTKTAVGATVFELIRGSRFGAYVLGTPHGASPTKDELEILLLGQAVPFTGQGSTEGEIERAQATEVDACLDGAVRSMARDRAYSLR